MRQAFYTLLSLVLLLTLIGCGSDLETDRKRKEAEDMVYHAYLEKDYQRIVTLADSLMKEGFFSEGKGCYWLGYAYDRMMQKRMAELYWNTGIAAVENSDKDEDVRVYAGITNRLTGLLCTWSEYESALKVAIPAVERLKKMERDTTSEYINLLIYVGCCQSRFGLSEEDTRKRLEEGYNAHLEYIRHHPYVTSYRDAIVGVINICYNYLEVKDYKESIHWIDRLGELIKKYEEQDESKPDYTDKQWARYYIYRATALEGLKREEDATEFYKTFLQTDFSRTVEGKVLGSDYLCLAERWQEAADNYMYLNELMNQYKTNFSLETIQKLLLKKYNINVKAGRRDTAQAVSTFITQHLDSAITQARRADAREEEAVHQKEQEMTAENERILQQRQIGRLAAMAGLIVLLIIYIIVRHRVQARLRKAHNDLQVAYDQLEEATTIKERMESELRIARDIQMSMVPHTFPISEGLDMYASMTPAKEVGGDLYNYLICGNRLYFCLGDVSGKGVPASLFMTLAVRGFRTLALQGVSPAKIAARMNAELSEDNEQGMFVTMFICMFDMKQDRLEYCNAGHNPPVIGNADGQFTFLDVLSNAPIGLWPGLEYESETIDYFRNHLLLLYTDGLNEAENCRQEQYGDERILKLMESLSSDSAQDIIEAIKIDVEQFREGAEPNDDLTMLAFRHT